MDRSCTIAHQLISPNTSVEKTSPSALAPSKDTDIWLFESETAVSCPEKENTMDRHGSVNFEMVQLLLVELQSCRLKPDPHLLDHVNRKSKVTLDERISLKKKRDGCL